MNTVVLSGIYFCLCCQGKINTSTNDHSARTKSHHFEWHVNKYWETRPESRPHIILSMLKPDQRLYIQTISINQFISPHFKIKLQTYIMQWQTTIKTAAYNQQNNTSQKYTMKQKKKRKKTSRQKNKTESNKRH